MDISFRTHRKEQVINPKSYKRKENVLAVNPKTTAGNKQFVKRLKKGKFQELSPFLARKFHLSRGVVHNLPRATKHEMAKAAYVLIINDVV